MTESVQQLLTSFEALSEAERHEAAVELFRRFFRDAPSVIPEEALIEAADALFLELDVREAHDAESQTR